MAFWDNWDTDKKNTKVKVIKKGSSTSGLYCLPALGVLIYYLNTAGSFTEVILAFVKAVFWPAFLAYHVYGLLGMH